MLEAEIRRQAPALEASVASASTFKGGAYEQARDVLSLLAVLFAISAEHDEVARWQDSAAGLRDLFGRAGFNAKVGTDQTFREAAARSVDLAELIRGGRPEVPAVTADAAWTTVADRPPLMRRMELAQQERLSKWLANENLFGGNAEEISHEAQILTALAELIKREGYEFADDDTFVGYANELRDAAHELQQATDQENYAQARAALGRATKACSTCHEGYRG
jgi:cytochrome c556